MRARGFTLVEALVSVVIGALVMIGAFQLFKATSLASEQQHTFTADILAQEAILMLQADLEASEAVMLNNRRYRISTSAGQTKVHLMRNGTSHNSAPGLIAVVWSISDTGIRRWAGIRMTDQDSGYQLLDAKAHLKFMRDESLKLKLPVWELQLGDSHYRIWFPRT